jgi:hypothetical protein
MPFEGFVNPALALGALLCAVPLIIHLLNRQRHKPLPWAAMRFVMAAVRKTRRRVQLENLLLLLLRMAAVALLAFAVARPFIGAQSPLAGLAESRRDVVLVLDGSASTGYREDIDTVFERIVDRARRVLLELDAGRGDRARIVLAGDHPRLLSWTDPVKALAVLDTLDEPTHESLDLAAALGEVLNFAREEAAGTGQSLVEVRLLTDLQRRSFAGDDPLGGADADPPGALALREVLSALGELSVLVLVEDLSPARGTPPNVGVTAVEPLGPVLGPGAPVELRVSVTNFGAAPRSGLRVSLEIDGQRRPVELVDVGARSTAEVLFTTTFRTAGDHTVVARLEGDRLAVDDTRVAVVHCPAPVRVLLVNGDPAPEIERDAVGFLAAVLEPPLGDDLPGLAGSAPFLPRVITPAALEAGEVELSAFDVIWMADVATVTPDLARALERRVAAGGALVISLGDRVRTENWNQRLFRPDGSGLLPAELGVTRTISNRRDSYWRAHVFDATHPALRFFGEERWRPLFGEAPVFEFVSARPLELTRVLARLDDSGHSPLLLERDFDRGKVVLWTTSIDPSWTRLPESPRSLVPFVHELLRHVAGLERPPLTLRPGQELVAEVEAYPRGVELIGPTGERRALSAEAVEAGPGRWRLPPVRGVDTARAGLYRIAIEGAQDVSFAVLFDTREGDLERLLPGELEGLHPALRWSDPAARGSEGDNERVLRGELWRWLALAALLALIAESLWGAWLGYRRRIA